MVEIELRPGVSTKVDDDKFEFLSRFKWFAHQDYSGRLRALTTIHGKSISMSRILLGVGDSSYPLVDHKDGDTLNNQMDNLRLATHAQNNANSEKRRGKSSSKYKGVYWDGLKKWKAAITVNGKYIHLGKFTSEEEAAFAYDRAARKYFGEFAKLNLL